MKKILLLSLFTIFCAGIAVTAAPKVKKIDLRILYIGGSSDWERSFFVNSPNPEEAYRSSVKERMASFEKMLKTYFTYVTVLNADDYSEKMSYDYDVTVMDGLPKEITPPFQDTEKGIYLKPGYFTEDFDKPILTIGHLSNDLGCRIGTKNDWYCLCLDAYAHSWREEHPIFKGPFKIKMTIVNKPTPAEAFFSDFSNERPIPRELPMWKVQTKGYQTDEGFAIGLVSRGWGYEDSPDAEIISGGVSSKSLDAVAIGRHGNWFHWGFAASPTYMTDEAQRVLANAIVYISKFKGQRIIARKYNELIATSATLKEYKYLPTRKAYQQMLDAEEAANKAVIEMGEKAKAKKERGEKLAQDEEFFISFKPREPRSHEEILKLLMPDYFKMFGMDEKAYAAYFDENEGFFFDGNGTGTLVVDEDAKSLGIHNNDIRLIEEAVNMLETKRDTEKARRILNRYTLVDFNTATEWRNWLDKNRAKLFFTEAGGWVWLVNSRESGVNNYRIWKSRKALSSMPAGETSINNPVAVNATLETLYTGEKALYIKVKVHPGYHIYSHVSPKDPYIQTKVEITLPDGYKKTGDMKIPAGRSYNQNGTTILEETVIFSQVITGDGEGPIECSIEYQCCNNNICFPPTVKRFSLKTKPHELH